MTTWYEFAALSSLILSKLIVKRTRIPVILLELLLFIWRITCNDILFFDVNGASYNSLEVLHSEICVFLFAIHVCEHIKKKRRKIIEIWLVREIK